MPILQGVTGNQPWSNQAPGQALEVITTFNLDEKRALASDPGPDFAWARQGTKISRGVGIIKVPYILPQHLRFSPFKPGGTRNYITRDAAVQVVKPEPLDLSFSYPMIFDEIGNGWMLQSNTPDGIVDFLGIGDAGSDYVLAGRNLRAELAASLVESSLYVAGVSTTPKKFTFPQPNNPGGIALFTDGTGAEGSGGAQHYANPTVAGSKRYKNVWNNFGSFELMFGASLSKMAQTPHPLFPFAQSGASCTDVVAPTHMREKLFKVAIQTLSLEVNGSEFAGTTNAYSLFQQQLLASLNEESFVGVKLGAKRFWVAPQFDNHPYLQANPGADMWLLISAGTGGDGKPRPSWAHLGANNEDMIATFHMYGAGDPLAQQQRLCRIEGDVDAAVEPGAPTEVHLFFGSNWVP